MKNISIILVVILLFGVGGAVAFVVLKKKKDKEKTSSSALSDSVVSPILENKAIGATTNNKPVTKTPVTNPVTNQGKTTNEAVQMDIVVSDIDTNNRRFEYDMHYQGVRYKGIFEDGVTAPMIQVKKGFGSFMIQQLKRTKATSPKTKGDKMGSSLAVKNDLVSLSILDLKGQTLKQVNVNLATGEQKSLNINSISNLRTL